MASSAIASATLLAACILLALLAASSAPVATAQSCTTNSGSPTQGDANTCVQFVQNRGVNGVQCCQTGSGCTNMAFAGTAAVDICGPQGSCTSCTAAGNSLNTILANCVRNKGGTARVADSIASSSLIFQIRRT